MLTQTDIDNHFATSDPVLAAVIPQVGPYTLKPKRNHFKTLVGSIISQQISTAAARTIRGRLEDSLRPQRIQPQTIAALPVDQLRSVGLSKQKASYLLDLSQKCVAGEVRLSRLNKLSDDAVIEELTQVKGIGRWSAQMFLIFALGRLDIFPQDDLGVRSAIQRIYGLAELPRKNELAEIGARWRPYATVASWYCWRYLDLSTRKSKPPD